jgi:hypothetical protein
MPKSDPLASVLSDQLGAQLSTRERRAVTRLSAAHPLRALLTTLARIGLDATKSADPRFRSEVANAVRRKIKSTLAVVCAAAETAAIPGRVVSHFATSEPGKAIARVASRLGL